MIQSTRMLERDKPISKEEADRLKATLDDLVPHLEREKRLQDQEEEAILQSIEWAIRQRTRSAQVQGESSIATHFEQWLDNLQKQCVWLLTQDTWIFPEESRSKATRHVSDHCVSHLVLGVKRTDKELSKELVLQLFHTWTTRFEPVSVNLLIINAVVKRRMFYYKRQTDLGLLRQPLHIDEYKREYEIHLALHRILNQLIEDGILADDDFYEPPLPF